MIDELLDSPFADLAFHKAMLDDRRSDRIGFYELPYQKRLVKDINTAVKELKDRFENFVVLGIGGSALGNTALHMALNHPHYNELSKTGRKRAPRIYVMDNVDPDRLAGLLDILDLKKTCFNVITKSGGTAETMANFLVCQEALINAVGREDHKDRIVVTTDASREISSGSPSGKGIPAW